MQERTQHTVLCIDDEKGVLESLKRVLMVANYRTLVAESGQEALDILSREKADIVIVDQRMPHMTGSEFLRIARERDMGLTAIMLSGYTDFDGLVSAINEGEIVRFISKPWHNQILLDAVASAVEKRKQRLLANMCSAAQNDLDDPHRERGTL